MRKLPKKSLKFLSLIFALAAGFIFPSPAQVAEQNVKEMEVRVREVEVPVQQKIGSRYYRCFALENAVYDAEKFRQFSRGEDCAHLSSLIKVDFERQTLVGFRVRGDCFISGIAKVFRNDEAKKYHVRIKNIWGGCRAAGTFQGWLVIEKTLPGYTVDFAEIKVDGMRAGAADGDFSLLALQRSQKYGSAPPPEILETRAIDLKGCIQTIYTKQFVIKDEATYLKTIRSDASRERCLKDVEKIDFGKHTLLGMAIDSGYCRVPAGLTYKAARNDAERQYVLSVSYIDPQGSVCRAFSQYDLWVLVPKLPADYEVRFDLTSRLPEK